MIDFALVLLAYDPTTAIYALQCCTYGAATVLAKRSGHAAIACCYGASAILHGLLFAFHFYESWPRLYEQSPVKIQWISSWVSC